jgi:hypothetical protein
LPRHNFGVFGVDGETDAFRLRDVQRFEILTERRLQFCSVFLIRLWDIGIVVGCPREELCRQRKTFNADNFVTNTVDDARKVERVSIMVERRMLLVGIN